MAEERTVTKADLVDRIHEAIGPGVTKKDCAAVVDGFLNAVKQTLADENRIELRGFGTFEVRYRDARTARNPRTGEPVEVPPRTVPVFRASKLWKEKVAEEADWPEAG